MTLDNQCVAGMKRFQELDPNQFKPLPSAAMQVTGDATWKQCQFCHQMTLVKLDGFFVQHNESIKGHVPSSMATASGKPARVRGRRQG